MNETRKCFIMGLPNAGKTTYLAALWYSLNNALQNTMIKLYAMEDAKYLADLSKKWINAEKLDRTKLGYEKTNILIDIVSKNSNIFKLQFPDLSGETFQNQYERREISNELIENIISADGILMFINISDVKDITFISEVPSELIFLIEDKVKIEPITIRNPKQDDPVQVQVIELLQFVKLFKNNNPTNLGIILSAWDLAKDLGIDSTPEEYVKKKMNMLWQFIISNSTSFVTSFWGVSAQGGKLENEEELLNYPEPMDRIIVVDNNGDIYHDITMPIYKIVGGDNV